MNVSLDLSKLNLFLNEEELQLHQKIAGEICREILEKEDTENVLGWRTLEQSAVQLDVMREKAREIRENADVFVIVGVGGSNQAARAMIEALKDRNGPEVLYLGNTLSPYYIRHVLAQIEGKSIYIDVIAKNFETLEPGSHFRILRQWMRKHYTKEEMAKRVIVTGTYGSRLEEIAKENGFLFLSFPESVGGRYSAFTPVRVISCFGSGAGCRWIFEGRSVGYG